MWGPALRVFMHRTRLQLLLSHPGAHPACLLPAQPRRRPPLPESFAAALKLGAAPAHPPAAGDENGGGQAAPAAASKGKAVLVAALERGGSGRIAAIRAKH